MGNHRVGFSVGFASAFATSGTRAYATSCHQAASSAGPAALSVRQLVRKVRGRGSLPYPAQLGYGTVVPAPKAQAGGSPPFPCSTIEQLKPKEGINHEN